MSVPEGMIAWAVRFGATSYVLNVDGDAAGASDETFNEDGSNLDTTANYYMIGAGAGKDILRLLKNCIEGHSSGILVDAYLNDSGFVQIDLVSGTSFAINWEAATTTLDPTLFGFGYSDTGAVTSVTASSLPKGIWRPTFPISVDDKERDQIVGGVSMSISGKVRVSNFGTAEKDRRLMWEMLPKEAVIQDYAVIPQASFQYAWLNSIALGYPFRYYPNDTVQSSVARKTYRIASLEDPMVRSAALHTLWDVDLRCRRDSSADYSSSVYSFDGDTDNTAYIQESSPILSGDTAFTISMWFASNADDTKRLMAQYTSGDLGFMLRKDSSTAESVVFYVATGASTAVSIQTATGLLPADDSWNHIAAVFDGSAAETLRMKIYINGEMVKSGVAGSPTSLRSNAGGFGIGSDGNGGSAGLDGWMDDAAIWNRALTPAEISIVMNGLPTDVPDSLIRWWPFERDWTDAITGTRPTLGNTPAFAAVVR